MFGFFNPSTIINPSFCNSRYLDWQAHFWDSSSRYWMSAVPMMNNCFSTFGFGMPHPADTMMRYNQTGPNFSSPLFGNNWSFMGWNGSTLGASTSNQSTDSSTSDENKQYKNLRALLNKIKENENLSAEDSETIQEALDKANGAGSVADKLEILQDAYEKISNDSVKLSVVIEEEKNNLLKAGYELDNTKADENVKKFKEEIDSLPPSNYDTINAKNLIRGTNIIDFISSWNDSNETDIITYLENRKEKTGDTNINDEIDNVIKFIFDELIKEAKKLRSELKEGDYDAISCLFNFVGGNITKAEQITMLYSAVRSAKRNILEYELNKKYSENTEISDKICADLDTDLESELKKICDKNNWGDYETFNYKGLNFTHKDAKVEKAEEETATEEEAAEQNATGKVENSSESNNDDLIDKDMTLKDAKTITEFNKTACDNKDNSAAYKDGRILASKLQGYTDSNDWDEVKNLIAKMGPENVFVMLAGYLDRDAFAHSNIIEQIVREDAFEDDKIELIEKILECAKSNLQAQLICEKSKTHPKNKIVSGLEAEIKKLDTIIKDGVSNLDEYISIGNDIILKYAKKAHDANNTDGWFGQAWEGLWQGTAATFDWF